MSLYRADLPRTLALVVALFLTVIEASAFAREFRAADTQSKDYPTVQALTCMGHPIEQRTVGRLKIRVFHSRQLGEEKETIEQTRVGAIDLNRTNVALIGSFEPSMNVLAMPFLFRSIDHLQKVLDGPIGDEILGGFERYGFVGLAFYDSGARSIYNNVRPVRTLADLKGLRIRVQQSELMSEEKWRDLEDRSCQQAGTAGITIIRDFDRKPFEAAMGGLYEKMQRDPAAARLIERIREVE